MCHRGGRGAPSGATRSRGRNEGEGKTQRVPDHQEAMVPRRSHVCRRDGSDFMTFDEALLSIPSLLRWGTRREMLAAWNLLISDLRRLQVRPVPGEEVNDALTMWRQAASSRDGEVEMGEQGPICQLLDTLHDGNAPASASRLSHVCIVT